MTPPLAAALLPLLLLALAGRSRAQEDGSANQITSTSSKVWAAVAFINHGETTPFLRSASPVLTPSGAQQLYRQGTAFRGRYLAPSTVKNASSSSSSSSSPEAATIQGLSQNAIDNAQLKILAQTDEWVVGGAVAFMQALYPPNSNAFSKAAGGQTSADNGGNSNATSYPLDGYQYPQIETLASTDANSVGIQGHVGCPTWQHASTANLTTNPTLKDAAQKSADFYTKLFSSGPLQGAVAADDANLFNAYDIYNLVRYENMHNATVASNLANADETLARLAADAFTMERAKSDPGSSTANDTASVALTIAGRTLAHLVADQLVLDANRTASRVQRLTLLFGSFQPLMALFSVAGLLTRDNVLSTAIGNVTAPGAAIVFELIGQNAKGAAGFPKPEDLSVRFVFRPTADESDAFQVFSLFGSGNGGRSIPYLAFREKMAPIGREAADWCRICKPSGSASAWCQEGTAGGADNGRARMSPAVAGVIGAVIMGALVALAVLALCGPGGFRLRRRSRDGAGARGAEKRGGDPDVTYGSGGEAQERIGSWEMKGQPKSESRVQQQRRSLDEDAGSDVENATPVKTREVF
ncbi:hypothetical protein BM221_001304 [Beauveria bassiana]|uniref:Histidine acid phosphatase n=1 Tax=Beauveria bassiana TaxID=176275 RepID=A0A2N6P302_BEABA|nr:hypothetical protein BM221_001304 [Beauveria bassiana]